MSKWFTDTLKRQALLGATVIRFDCDGCMAHDHKMVWIGEVVGFEPSTSANMSGYWKANIRVLKNNKRPGDIRDGEFDPEYAIIEDGSLQEIRPGLFFYYK